MSSSPAPSDRDTHVAATTKRRVTKAELEAALAALLDAEWMVTCDWTTPDKREPILAEARRVLGRDDG